ncbi:unnamed protein product, partial [Ectocarpus fasciculatus]
PEAGAAAAAPKHRAPSHVWESYNPPPRHHGRQEATLVQLLRVEEGEMQWAIRRRSKLHAVRPTWPSVHLRLEEEAGAKGLSAEFFRPYAAIGGVILAGSISGRQQEKSEGAIQAVVFRQGWCQ